MMDHLTLHRGSVPMKKSLSDSSNGLTNGHPKAYPPSPGLHGNASKPRAVSLGNRLKWWRRGLGRRKVVAALAILVASFLLTFGHTLPQNYLTSYGTSYLRASSSYRMPRGVHPIKHLMEQAEQRFDRMMARQSQSLEDALEEYRRRYRRNPPKGFDIWWKFAKDRGLALVDEFDTIHRDLEPFWGLSPEQIERRRKELFTMANSDHIIGIKIREGEISDEDGPASSAKWPQNKDYFKLFQPFSKHLPDLDFLINVNDQPLGFVTWEEKQRLIEAGQQGVFASDDDELPPDPIAFEKTRGFAFEDLRAACHPDSAVRTFTADLVDDDTYPLQSSSELSFRLPPSQGGFIHNMTRASDACHNPALRDQHGNFLKPELSIRCVRNRLYPIFSWSKYPASADITIPTNFRFQWGPADTAKWEEMHDKVMWRGTLTGMFADTQAVMKSQRHRLIALVQDTWARWPMLLLRNGTLQESSVLMADAVGRWAEVGFTHRSWWRGTEPENIVDATIRPSERINNKERAKYKMLLDVDGWGWSARYRELLRTTSATIKATVFHEACTDWLIPWYHYIPLNYDYSDLFSITAYFFGLPESEQEAHDDDLRAIAERSKQWTDTQLGWEQQKVYIFRLCLEWARICAEDRSMMDYDAPSVSTLGILDYVAPSVPTLEILDYEDPSEPTFSQPKVDWTETVERIRVLQVKLDERFPRNGWASHRHATLDALDRLAECMTSDTCGPGEKTIMLLGSFHFGNSQEGHTSGEDIWTGSLVTIMEHNNFTLLYAYQPLEIVLIHQALGDFIPLIFMEGDDIDECLKMHKLTLEAAKEVMPPITGVDYLSAGERFGCAKRVGFEEGIPLVKVRILHFWLGQRHPLRGWTVSPENYTNWQADTGNYYLGYHLEHCRHVKSALTHKRRAFILGKRAEYFADGEYAWPRGALSQLTEDIGGGFEFVGAAGVIGVDEMPEPGIRNLGRLDKPEWTQAVAESAVLLGVGHPPMSPSPYDAWCLGVPFINPINWRHPNHPLDKRYWKPQHEALRWIEPPYVYNVYKENVTELREAIQSALDNPFPPYIPDKMKFENVEARLLKLVYHNWTEEAIKLIDAGRADQFARPDTGQNVEHGLLL